MKKQLQLFFTCDDEADFSVLLRVNIPEIKFLNGSRWPEHPDYRENIQSCDSNLVYLYEGLPEALPTVRRKTGELQGPGAGCVIQLIRALLQDGVLLSGTIGAGFDDADGVMNLFVKKVWKTLRELGSIGVVRPDGAIDTHYLVGHGASADVSAGRITIADRAVRIPYTLPA